MFNDTLDAITDYLKRELSDTVKDVSSHPGRFTQGELSKLLLKKRAVRVSIEQSPGLNITGSGWRDARLILAVYVICGDAKESDRHRAALDITERIITLLPFNRFDTDFLMPVVGNNISADNLYSGEIDKKGMSMWGISWEQAVKNKKKA